MFLLFVREDAFWHAARWIAETASIDTQKGIRLYSNLPGNLAVSKRN